MSKSQREEQAGATATTKRQQGQATVEMVLLLPLLVALLLGSIDLSRAFGIWMTLSNAAREGARYGSKHAQETYVQWYIEYCVVREAEAEGIPGEDVHVEVDWPGSKQAGTPVVVEVSYDMPLITLYLFGGQPVTIRASSQMMILE